MKIPNFYSFLGAFIAINVIFSGVALADDNGTNSNIPIFCSNQKIIYAQDINNVTPGNDNDTAIIKDKNGNLLLQINQKSDDYVLWTQTITVSVSAGDILHYFHGSVNNHFLTFDVLNSNNSFLQKLSFSSTNNLNNPFNISQDGFLRFNQGELAQEYNALLLCPQANNPNPNPNPNPINQAPVWNQTAVQNGTIGQNLQFIVSATDPDNNSLTYSAFNLPFGAGFNPTNKTFSWTPTSGQAGTYVITFRVFDGTISADMNVTINIVNTNNPVNQPPVWSQTPNQTVAVSQMVQFTVFASDPENNSLFYSALNLPAGSFFSSATKNFSWVPSVGQTGIYTVTFRVTDGVNTVDMNTPINVLNNNYNYNSGQQAPVWSQLPTQYINTGQTLQFTVSATDFYTNSLTYSSFNLPAGAYFNAFNRNFTWTPTNGQTGTYNVTFRVSNTFASADMNVSINVNGAGGPSYNYNYPNYNYPTNFTNYQTPVFTSSLPTILASEGQVYTYTAQATCGGGPVTYRVLVGPNGLTINQSFGVILWVPNFNQGRLVVCKVSRIIVVRIIVVI
jgi:hypothetical protein